MNEMSVNEAAVQLRVSTHKTGTVGAMLHYLKRSPQFATPEDVRELEQQITEARRRAREQAGVQ